MQESKPSKFLTVALVAVCLAAFAMSGIALRDSRGGGRVGTVTDQTTVRSKPKLHAIQHVTGGDDVIANAVPGTGGASGLETAADKLAFDRKEYGPAKRIIVSDDFIGAIASTGSPTCVGASASAACISNIGWRAQSTAAGGSVTSVTTGQTAAHLGILEIVSGTNSAGGAGITRGGTGSTFGMVLGTGQLLTQKWWVMPAVTLSDGTNTFVTTMGWQGSIATLTDGCFAQYGSASPASGTIICRMCSTAGGCTNGTGGTPPTVQAATWYSVSVSFDGSTNTCSCAVDGVNIGSIVNTTVPTLNISPTIQVFNSAGSAGTQKARVDFYHEDDTFTTTRQ